MGGKKGRGYTERRRKSAASAVRTFPAPFFHHPFPLWEKEARESGGGDAPCNRPLPPLPLSLILHQTCLPVKTEGEGACVRQAECTLSLLFPSLSLSLPPLPFPPSPSPLLLLRPLSFGEFLLLVISFVFYLFPFFWRCFLFFLVWPPGVCVCGWVSACARGRLRCCCRVSYLFLLSSSLLPSSLCWRLSFSLSVCAPLACSSSGSLLSSFSSLTHGGTLCAVRPLSFFPRRLRVRGTGVRCRVCVCFPPSCACF